jgi:hypothetical protein
MQDQVLRVSIGAAAALALAVPIYAKAPLQRITISGGGLAEPIIVTDQEALALSNPWHGTIANWSADVAPPPDDRPAYEITLHARLRGPEVKPIYQLRYVKGDRGAPGSVYLPGRGEACYRQNVSIIYREGHDGHWHVATAAWEAAIQRALSRDAADEVRAQAKRGRGPRC